MCGVEGAEVLLVWAVTPGAASAEEQPPAGTPADGVGAGAVPRRQLFGAAFSSASSSGGRWPDSHARPVPWWSLPPMGILTPPTRSLLLLWPSPALCALPRSPWQAPQPPRDGGTCRGEEPVQHRGGVCCVGVPWDCAWWEPRACSASPSAAVGHSAVISALFGRVQPRGPAVSPKTVPAQALGTVGTAAPGIAAARARPPPAPSVTDPSVKKSIPLPPALSPFSF